uniref:Complement C3-like n=1 Tax=Salarias fasciatus TaxID=181472 RepID=A0A672HAG4_SALFA
MRKTLLPLLASLAFASLTASADKAPLKVLSAPNLLRVETTENIFVECQDCTGGDIRVQINVLNHPTKTKYLDSTSVTLTRQNNYQMFGQVKIPAVEFSRDPSVKQYVYLQAQFDDQSLEKVVLVSFQSGHIFIQTDKTVYTPDSSVRYRLFAVTPQMEPVERDPRTRFEDAVDIEIVVMFLSLFFILITFPRGAYVGINCGLWKVVSRFQSNPQQSYSSDFEVKEYVLPSFEVKLKPRVPFFYVDSSDLTVEIRATYLFGEAVDGTAYVMFGVMQDGQKKGFPASIQRLPVQRGEGSAVLKREHITQTVPNIQELVGDSMFVSVSVLTKLGTEMVEAEVRGIQIVTSPYTIHFKKTPRYFKPGMSFDLTVEVLNPDETPAGNVPVLLFPGDIQGVTGSNGIARFTVNPEGNRQFLDIQVSPRRFSSKLCKWKQKRVQTQLFIGCFITDVSPNEKHSVCVDSADVKIGSYLMAHLSLNSLPVREQDITYLILSRGQLLKFGRFKTQGQVLIALNIPITKEMLPSFRIVAYYHVDHAVVSDSVWVDVKDSCMGSLKLELERPAASYPPRKMLHLKVTGDPGATVGLVAVDKGVYVLNNKHRLTQKKVWDKVEKHDTGCTPGGGKDGMGVFHDAGLLFVTHRGSGTPHRLELKCAEPQAARRKRASPLMEVPTTLGEEDDDSYVDSIDIFTRSSFPESWLWTDVDLPASCRGLTVNNPNSQFNVFHLRLSFSSHPSCRPPSTLIGICVGEPLEVIARKQFFIDLKLPYSAVRGEQLEIKAILHNYSPDAITVRVDLMEAQHVCSAAFKHGPYRQEVNVGPQTTLSVPFFIVPMREGEVQIEVKAAVKDSSLNDGIMKRLRVVPGGVLVRSSKIISLDPEGGIQEEILNSQIPRKDMIPHSIESTHIFITGREDISALMENAISGKSMAELIYKPSGPGEPNMIHMTHPVIATIYLDRTNQWEAVGFQKRAEALQHIKTGYYQELAFRKWDGSFAVWPNRPSSSWLTAYVAKVFTMAHSLVAVQEEVICDAIKYLILNTQQPDGMFGEVGIVILAEMTGDVKGRDTDASMTAFKLIAMQESRPLCAATVNGLSGSIDKAVSYLERHLDSLTNPYAVAMTSYALANEGKLNREVLYRFVSRDLSHWPVPRGHQYTLEATAYALLALVKTRAFKDSRPVVRWFTQQQLVGGGLGSTQATLMVCQALSEYWINAEKPEYHLNVDILMPGRPKPYKFNVNRENHHLTRTLKSNGINHNMTVRATGSGEATVTMVSMYYALPQEKQSDCQRFNMSVELIPEKMDVEEKVFQLRIEVLHNDKKRDSTMTVLDIGLLPGFTVDTDDLNLLSEGRAYTIAKYEMNNVLSERGSLIIYLDKVSHIRPEEISFRVRQTLKVGVLQPAAVSVYEYYKETKCVKLYHPERRAGQPLWFCRGGECTCVAEGSCSLQKKGKISNDERSAKICEATLTNKTEFAYKVQLEETVADLSTDTYTVRILDVIKEGNTDVGPMGKLRSFLSHQHCRGAVGLQKGKTYLIMGSSQDIRRDDQEQTYVQFWYMLDEKTWVEYWPTTEECQTDEHRPSCSGLEHMVDQFQVFSCRQ